MGIGLYTVIGKVHNDSVDPLVQVILQPVKAKVPCEAHAHQRREGIEKRPQGKGKRGVDVDVGLVIAMHGVDPVGETQGIKGKKYPVLECNHKVTAKGEPVIEIVSQSHGIIVVSQPYMQMGDL
jgi:hypothetical protein